MGNVTGVAPRAVIMLVRFAPVALIFKALQVLQGLYLFGPGESDLMAITPRRQYMHVLELGLYGWKLLIDLVHHGARHARCL